MANYTLHHGDSFDVLKKMIEDGIQVDAVICDPPYGLTGVSRNGSSRVNDPETPFGRTKLADRGFMGKRWDAAVPSVEFWRLVYQVLKPGGHVLSFGGTRTYHRMAVAIEDAGFEIRDQIMWVTGTGFPKNLSVSKAIDKAARGVPQGGSDPTSPNHGNFKGGCSDEHPEGRGFGAGPGQFMKEGRETNNTLDGGAKAQLITDEAKPWVGWGSSLKPSHENLLIAKKEHHKSLESLASKLALHIFRSLCRLSSHVKHAALNSKSSQNELDADAFVFALWTAVAESNTMEDLFALMDTLPYESEIPSSLSIALSWLNILDAILNHGNTFTTKTRENLTIELKILNSFLSAIIPDFIIEVATGQNGDKSPASIVVKTFNDVREKLNDIHIPSVRGSATPLNQDHYPAMVGQLRPEIQPIALVRKPLSEDTVAANVLKHGTGAINIDGCRIELDGDYKSKANGRPSQTGMPDNYDPANANQADTVGRWPANLIHDGSDEILSYFPSTQSAKESTGNAHRDGEASAETRYTEEGSTNFAALPGARRFDRGSAARFFYCAKASKLERRGSKHPTVKPLALMRYLCRLITPPGGTILDPFAGTGTTGEAAVLEGFYPILIEREADYIPDIEKRMSGETSIPAPKKPSMCKSRASVSAFMIDDEVA